MNTPVPVLFTEEKRLCPCGLSLVFFLFRITETFRWIWEVKARFDDVYDFNDDDLIFLYKSDGLLVLLATFYLL